jgi:hypothetical protein
MIVTTVRDTTDFARRFWELRRFYGRERGGKHPITSLGIEIHNEIHGSTSVKRLSNLPETAYVTRLSVP